MRFVGIVSVILLALMAAGIGLAREIGHGQAVDGVPLPGAEGCWQGLCFHALAERDIPAALRGHPDVAQYRGTGVPSRYFFDVGHSCQPEKATSTAVVLSFAPTQWYSLGWDWTVVGTPPLMRLGDVITALGPPDSVGLSSGGIELHYAKRGLAVIADVAIFRGYAARLWPSDSVFNLIVYYPEVKAAYANPGIAWQGFGAYHFGD